MNLKLGIVIPLKAKKVSENWETVCKNLWLTINALENQTCESFTWRVIGHDKPTFFKDSKFKKGTFIWATETPVPDKHAFKGDELRWAYEKDRCFKIDKGLRELLTFGTTHFMALDADDILHKDFVQTLKHHKGYNAFLIENGYMYFKNSNILIPNTELSAWCGSTCVIEKNILGADFITNKENSKSFFHKTSHCDYSKILLSNNYKCKVLQEKLLIYVQDNGENISREDSTDGKLKILLKSVKKKIKLYILSIKDKEIIFKDFYSN